MEMVEHTRLGMVDPVKSGFGRVYTQDQIKQLAKGLNEKASHMTAQEIEEEIRKAYGN